MFPSEQTHLFSLRSLDVLVQLLWWSSVPWLSPPAPPLDVSVSLLSLLVTTCGLALFSVSLFVSWKLCWGPLSGRFLPDILKGAHFLGGDQQPVLTEVRRRSSQHNTRGKIQMMNDEVITSHKGHNNSWTEPELFCTIDPSLSLGGDIRRWH